MPEPQDLRARARIRIELTARIRQINPPRNLVEITRTLDVSRNGILFRTREPYDANTTVWVTMPFVENALAQDIEFPACVVRVSPQPDGSSEIAVQFHSAYADRFRGSYEAEPARKVAPENIKKRRPRVKMTLPIRVRRKHASEESVTLDVSRSGVLFRAEQDYDCGDAVLVSLPHQPSGRIEEVPAVVVRTVERVDVRGVALHYTSGVVEAPPRRAAEGYYSSAPSEAVF